MRILISLVTLGVLFSITLCRATLNDTKVIGPGEGESEANDGTGETNTAETPRYTPILISTVSNIVPIKPTGQPVVTEKNGGGKPGGEGCSKNGEMMERTERLHSRLNEARDKYQNEIREAHTEFNQQTHTSRNVFQLERSAEQQLFHQLLNAARDKFHQEVREAQTKFQQQNSAATLVFQQGTSDSQLTFNQRLNTARDLYQQEIRMAQQEFRQKSYSVNNNSQLRKKNKNQNAATSREVKAVEAKGETLAQMEQRLKLKQEELKRNQEDFQKKISEERQNLQKEMRDMKETLLKELKDNKLALMKEMEQSKANVPITT